MITSTITPPVALASYATGGIAGANVNKVGWTVAAYAATSFVLPFAFVYGPGLLMGGKWLDNTAAAGLCLLFQGGVSAAIRVVLFLCIIVIDRTRSKPTKVPT